jgi:hypothetical protein
MTYVAVLYALAHLLQQHGFVSYGKHCPVQSTSRTQRLQTHTRTHARRCSRWQAAAVQRASAQRYNY